MTGLRQALGDYLELRRALGYKLERTELLLSQYVDELQARGASTITTANAIAWVTAPAGSRAWWLIRLAAVRGFANYLHALDARCEVPPSDLFARPRPATCPVPLHPHGACRPARRDRSDPVAAARSVLPDPDRAAGGHRPAGWRGARR